MIASLTIRSGTLADADALATLAARTFAETYGPHNRPEDLRAHLDSSFGFDQQSRELGDAATITLLAEGDDALLAYAQLRRNAPPPAITQEQPIELHRFYVDKTAHGHGVAQQLMTAVREEALASGAKHLWLGVWERNPRAIAFYAKCGFVEVGTHDFFVGSDRQCDRILVLML